MDTVCVQINTTFTFLTLFFLFSEKRKSVGFCPEVQAVFCPQCSTLCFKEGKPNECVVTVKTENKVWNALI